jgi:drug/metabolite transporter (DMT)-like permease
MTMEPVFAGLFGVTFGGDALSLRFAVGAAFVLVAMYAVELGPRHARDAQFERFE